MKYSWKLDVFLTLGLWIVLGLSFMGFLIAVVAGTVLSMKLCTGWHRFTARLHRLAGRAGR